MSRRPSSYCLSYVLYTWPGPIDLSLNCNLLVTPYYIYNVAMYPQPAAGRQSVSLSVFIRSLAPYNHLSPSPSMLYPSPILAQRPVAVRGAQETVWSRHGVKTSPPSALRFLVLDTPYYIHEYK